MILTLWKKEWKSNYKILLIFAAVLTVYTSIIISMFDPRLGDSLNMMMESMPEVFVVFGMSTPGVTLLDFLVNYLYGFLYIVFPMIFLLLLANRLIIRYTDRGSMTYLLAAPVKRSRIAVSQIVTAVIFMFLLLIYVTLLELAVSEMLFHGELDVAALVKVNAGLFCLYVFLTGVCMCAACVFNEAKWALFSGCGLCIFFFMVQMLSQAGEKLEVLRYITPLTLFAPEKLAAGESAGFWGALILLISGVGLSILGTVVFCRKDLSI